MVSVAGSDRCSTEQRLLVRALPHRSARELRSQRAASLECPRESAGQERDQELEQGSELVVVLVVVLLVVVLVVVSVQELVREMLLA